MQVKVIQQGSADSIVVSGSGIQGAKGASAYEEWLAAGNTGTVTDFLNSLQGQASVGASIVDNSISTTTAYSSTKIEASLALKANTGSSYTKAESDSQSTLKADVTSVYTKAQVDTNLASKVALNDVLSPISNTNKVVTQTELVTKANQGTTYTKSEIDAKVQTDVPTGAKFTDTVYDDSILVAKDAIQDTAITLNTAKVGITTTQANEITANTAKVSYPSVDASKLASIEPNATVDQTKADIDALGIDASTVNGKTIGTNVPSGAVFTDTQLTVEQVQDMVNTLFQAGTHTNVTVTYDDVNNSISLAGSSSSTNLTQEQVEDYVGGVVVGGTGISVVYNDAGNQLSIALAGVSFTSTLLTKLNGIATGANNYVLPTDVVQDASYVHTDNNYTTAEKALLASALQSETAHPSDALVVQDITDIQNLSGTNSGDQDLSGLQTKLVSGTNIKTVGGVSLLGSGDIPVGGNLVSGVDVKTINGQSVVGGGDLTVTGTGNIPNGGTTGQTLTKGSNADGVVVWADTDLISKVSGGNRIIVDGGGVPVTYVARKSNFLYCYCFGPSNVGFRKLDLTGKLIAKHSMDALGKTHPIAFLNGFIYCIGFGYLETGKIVKLNEVDMTTVATLDVSANMSSTIERQGIFVSSSGQLLLWHNTSIWSVDPSTLAITLLPIANIQWVVEVYGSGIVVIDDTNGYVLNPDLTIQTTRSLPVGWTTITQAEVKRGQNLTGFIYLVNSSNQLTTFNVAGVNGGGNITLPAGANRVIDYQPMTGNINWDNNDLVTTTGVVFNSFGSSATVNGIRASALLANSLYRGVNYDNFYQYIGGTSQKDTLWV